VVMWSSKEVLMCAFVLKADHPWYCLHFEDGKVMRLSAEDVHMVPKSQVKG